MIDFEEVDVFRIGLFIICKYNLLYVNIIWYMYILFCKNICLFFVIIE